MVPPQGGAHCRLQMDGTRLLVIPVEWIRFSLTLDCSVPLFSRNQEAAENGIWLSAALLLREKSLSNAIS